MPSILTPMRRPAHPDLRGSLTRRCDLDCRIWRREHIERWVRRTGRFARSPPNNHEQHIGSRQEGQVMRWRKSLASFSRQLSGS
jgi:hypothetical protein